jgi:hypothetical protein
MSIEILFADYVRNVRCNSQSASVLRARLVHAAPKDMSAEERKALRALTQACDDLMEVQAERDRLMPAKVRPLLIAFVNAWSAMHDALYAASRVAPASGDDVPRERAIMTSLFPDGIAFTQFDAESAWAEGNRRLVRMHGEQLEAPLVDIIGKNFLLAVRKATSALAEAIGTGRSERMLPSAAGLQEALARFGRTVGAYGRVLAANCDETDPAQVERFMHAMAPIDQHRANARSNSSAGDEPAPDTTDVVTSDPAANDAPTSAAPTPTVTPVTVTPVTVTPAEPVAA